MKKKYSELSTKVYENLDNKNKASIYAKAYLTRAKNENTQLGLGTGYRLHSILEDDEYTKIVYLDSAINSTLSMDNKYYPALLLFEKGSIYYTKREFKNALDSYVLGHSYAKNNNEELLYLIKFNIGLLKRRIGYFEEAEKIFNECLNYEKDYKDFNNGEGYFKTLFQLSNIYYETNQTSKATKINSLGIIESLMKKDSVNYCHFVVNEGINLTVKGSYSSAIDSISKAIPKIKSKADLAVAYYYYGIALNEIGREEVSVGYFKKVDSIFLETNDLLPSLRPTYEKLINFYKESNNQKEQLHYTSRLLELDKILNSNYKYLVKNLSKQYDIPELIEEKEKLIKSLKLEWKKSELWNIFLLITCILVFLGLLYHYNQKKIYQKRFDSLVDTQTQKYVSVEEEDIVTETEKVIDIDDKIVKKVLEKLQYFEQEEKFTVNQITLSEVAKQINTNSKYLSKIINVYKEKSFTNYINDLRVNYLIRRIQEESNFRKYTINAMAREGGFTNANAFARAFYKKTGLKPSYFINKINEP